MSVRLGNLAAGVILGAALAACAEPGTSKESESTMSREEKIELRRDLQNQKGIEKVQQDDSAPATGEVPDDLLDKVYADLELRTGGERSSFMMMRGEAVQWNDGSLGCAEPGQTYTQGIVDGYWIVIEYQNTSYDYRATVRGYFKLCPGVTPIR
jgi:hypothetical protein